MAGKVSCQGCEKGGRGRDAVGTMIGKGILGGYVVWKRLKGNILCAGSYMRRMGCEVREGDMHMP